MTGKTTISLEAIYNILAVFFVGTISFIILILFGNYFLHNANLIFIINILSFLIFGSYFYLAVSFSIYYLIKANRRIRESYSKYYKYYWGGIIFLFLAIILIFGYMFLPWEQYAGTVFSAILFVILGAIVWFFNITLGPKIKKILRESKS